MTANRLLDEILIRMMGRGAAGTTEGELLFFLKSIAHIEPTHDALRLALRLLIATGEVTYSGSNPAVFPGTTVYYKAGS